MNCQQFREMMDSYISNELLVETNHEILHHLEHCPDCRRKLSTHQSFRKQLRSALRSAPEMQLSPAFAANLRNNLRETALRPNWWEISSNGKIFSNTKVLLTAAICLLVVTSLGIFLIKYRNDSPDKVSVAENQSNNQTESNNIVGNVQTSPSPITQAIQAAWREMTRLAIGDHENCAVKFHLAEKPISLEEASEKYGKFNKDLDKAVIKPLQEIFPAGSADQIKLLEAHSCVFDGRRFAHIVLSRQNHKISVLVTDADSSNEPDGKLDNQTIDNLQVAGLKTKNYAVFIISDLTATENLTVAQTISSSVQEHIEKFNA